jgi:hypothetical protein
VKYFNLEGKTDLIEQIVLAKLSEAMGSKISVTPISQTWRDPVSSTSPSPHR